MLLDDRAADREPQTHAIALRRIEGIEQLVHALRIDPYTDVPDAHTHAVAVLSLGSDQQVPGAVVHVDHRVRAIAEQVQKYLLKLDPIPGDGREILGELRLQRHTVSL